MPDAAPHDHLRINGCYRCVWPDGATDTAAVGWAEVDRLREENEVQWEQNHDLKTEVARLRATLQDIVDLGAEPWCVNRACEALGNDKSRNI